MQKMVIVLLFSQLTVVDRGKYTIQPLEFTLLDMLKSKLSQRKPIKILQHESLQELPQNLKFPWHIVSLLITSVISFHYCDLPQITKYRFSTRRDCQPLQIEVS